MQRKETKDVLGERKEKTSAGVKFERRKQHN